MSAPCDVVVVGSGPNGLAAAVLCAAAGLSVTVLEAEPEPGGGCRTQHLDLGVPLMHDVCSAVHPMAVASPFFAQFDLEARGVRFGHPDISYAHPLDGRPAALAYRDLSRAVGALEEHSERDARLYRRIMTPLVDNVDVVRGLGLSDVRSVPSAALSPRGIAAAVTLAGRALQLGTPLWDKNTDAPACGAMLTGVGAHANTPIPSLAGAATALLLGTLAHSHGWPIPVGGSKAITDALTADLAARGATVACDVRIESAEDLPPARAYLFDTAPWTLTKVFGDRLSPRYRRAIRRFTPNNGGVAKVDFALSEPVPWSDPRIGQAGTVHLGGTRAQMARAETETSKGRLSQTPMMLLSQPTVVDPTRIGPGGHSPLWSYAHVPNGSTRDITEIAISQIERFAPGFRDVVVGSRCIPASEMSSHNANYVGGDIAAGHVSLYRIIARPVPRWDPYRTPLPNVYLCSASTPPGPGVHGMPGVHAARRLLRSRFGIDGVPDIGPPASLRSGDP
ncbi:phytoene dehydrogenase-like oxidoreductase [Mycolicibacterium chubuense NBB4]|uniref:Phytoene dehydrogenase-like oxidoreductase n=1 Tax=Mycolicibacterium chubuense (strain NBB4) TaxID=710421 RepID=I4BE10_MYCCN|nr:NAD(P)/FAD-dependent oxidoreductase [Mycolicibacterium chubuense]AFM15517.1 phytoene dehydrogenase-like oxidoreductase [Mycolicibacterium chubuense NBB4]